MEFIKISNTELNSSRIGLGTWAMGGWLWGGSDKKDCIKTIYKALDNGINLIDTAPVYGFGKSEEIVGEAISQTSIRNEVIIATKVGLEWSDKGIFRNSTKQRILKEIDESLRRLKTDYIDLYQIHWPDPLVPFEETAEVMAKLLKDGKIRAIGVSNYSPEQMELFLKGSLLHSNQPPYNLFERGIDNHVLPFCDENNITMLLYGALCRGLLGGKLKLDAEFVGDDLRNFDPKFQLPVYENYLKVVTKLNEYARVKFGREVLHLSVRWMLDKCMNHISLWGARKPEQLDEVKNIVNWKLNTASLDEIEEIAHSIKGSSYQMGMNRLGNVCKKLESCIDNGNVEITNDLIKEVKSVFYDTCGAIDKILEE